MSTEELLKPRYLVVNNYPQSDLPVGTVLTEFSTCRWGNSEFEFTAHENYFTNCPAIFKSLQWWEQREVEDMPEYVKHSFKNEEKEQVIEIVKVIKARECNPKGSMAGMIELNVEKTEQGYDYIYVGADLLPATASDYTQYINSKPRSDANAKG